MSSKTSAPRPNKPHNNAWCHNYQYKVVRARALAFVAHERQRERILVFARARHTKVCRSQQQKYRAKIISESKNHLSPSIWTSKTPKVAKINVSDHLQSSFASGVPSRRRVGSGKLSEHDMFLPSECRFLQLQSRAGGRRWIWQQISHRFAKVVFRFFGRPGRSTGSSKENLHLSSALSQNFSRRGSPRTPNMGLNAVSRREDSGHVLKIF